MDHLEDRYAYFAVWFALPFAWLAVVAVVLTKYALEKHQREVQKFSTESPAKWAWETNSRLGILVVFTVVTWGMVAYLEKEIVKPRLPALNKEIRVLNDSLQQLKTNYRGLTSLLKGTPIRIPCKIPAILDKVVLNKKDVLVSITNSKKVIIPLLIEQGSRIEGESKNTFTDFNLYLDGGCYLDSIAQIEITVRHLNKPIATWVYEDTVAIKKFLLSPTRERRSVAISNVGYYTLRFKKGSEL